MPGSSAESQDETDSESDDETEKSPAEQNLDGLFVICSICFQNTGR